jgi:hypothetical protein
MMEVRKKPFKEATVYQQQQRSSLGKEERVGVARQLVACQSHLQSVPVCHLTALSILALAHTVLTSQVFGKPEVWFFTSAFYTAGR